MLSQEALEKMLGIKERTLLSAQEMADSLSVSFYPKKPGAKISLDVEKFLEKLRVTLQELHVKIVPFDQALYRIHTGKVIRRFFSLCLNDLLYIFEYPLRRGKGRFFIGAATMRRMLRMTRIKSGICVVMAGEYEDGELPIDNVSSFRKSSVIAVVDTPPPISSQTTFALHFDTAMSLFAHHMANIVVLVKGDEWVLYNFNASHPRYSLGRDFKQDVLHGLVPKIAAPIRPLRFTDMVYIREGFNPDDEMHREFVDDLVQNSRLLEKSGLYPPGKRLADLPFRSDFYRWIGAIHLDQRSGMSYGFLARQMPTALSELMPLSIAKKRYGDAVPSDADYFTAEGTLFITVQLPQGAYCMKVPEVWVLSQRSGSNKTNMDPARDLVKLGLKSGRICIQAPRGLRLTSDYRPSFDTGVILAHALGNAIVASILAHFRAEDSYAATLRTKGMALIHWHGYVDPASVPHGWMVYGIRNPNVSCSSPQASVYAIRDKLDEFFRMMPLGEPLSGDIHIEPHHGTNMSHTSIGAIAHLFMDNPKMASLGNSYLDSYSKVVAANVPL